MPAGHSSVEVVGVRNTAHPFVPSAAMSFSGLHQISLTTYARAQLRACSHRGLRYFGPAREVAVVNASGSENPSSQTRHERPCVASAAESCGTRYCGLVQQMLASAEAPATRARRPTVLPNSPMQQARCSCERRLPRCCAVLERQGGDGGWAKMMESCTSLACAVPSLATGARRSLGRQQTPLQGRSDRASAAEATHCICLESCGRTLRSALYSGATDCCGRTFLALQGAAASASVLPAVAQPGRIPPVESEAAALPSWDRQGGGWQYAKSAGARVTPVNRPAASRTRCSLSAVLCSSPARIANCFSRTHHVSTNAKSPAQSRKSPYRQEPSTKRQPLLGVIRSWDAATYLAV